MVLDPQCVPRTVTTHAPLSNTFSSINFSKCAKTVKILVLKGLKGCGNELKPQKNQSNYHISDTIQLEIKRIKVYNSKQQITVLGVSKQKCIIDGQRQAGINKMFGLGYFIQIKDKKDLVLFLKDQKKRFLQNCSAQVLGGTWLAQV